MTPRPRRRMRRFAGVARSALLVAVCAAALACSKKAVTSSAPPSPESATAAGPAGDTRAQTSTETGAEAGETRARMRAQTRAETRAQIEALDREITDALARAQIAPPAVARCSGAACSAALAEPFATPSPPSASDATCRPAASERCTDVCKLATSICRNQDRICELAKQLPGDDWAANKCTSARASCQAAHDRCCSCVL